MRYKNIIILILAIFILMSITCVSAGHADDTAISMDDTSQIDLVKTNEIITENEDNNQLTNDGEMEGNEPLQSSQNNVVSEEEGTFSELISEIGSGGNITLTKKYYSYDSGSTIEITTPGVIDGNGTTIDLKNENIQVFKVSVENVTFNNITLINVNFDNYGGGIYFDAAFGSVTNCKFTGNRAPLGSAIFFNNDFGSVINCSFINNSASNMGGAVYDNGQNFSVINCNFISNSAYNEGGAVFIAERYSLIENCNFINNTVDARGGAVYFEDEGIIKDCNLTNNAAQYGGAVYGGSAEECNFYNNTATVSGNDFYNTVVPIANFTLENFTSIYGSGESLNIGLINESGASVENVRVTIRIYKNDALIGTYYCLSCEDWPVNLDIGNYTAVFSVENQAYAVNPVNVSLTIKKIPTTVDVDFYSPIISGDDVTVNVFVDPWISCIVELHVGVKFYEVAVVDGMGTYTVSNLAKNNYEIKAVFDGNDIYDASESDVKVLAVESFNTSLQISLDKTTMSYYDKAYVGIVLNRSINAIVTVKVNGNNYTVGLVNGKGKFTLINLHRSIYEITAVFAGDDRYEACTSNNLTLNVTGDDIHTAVSVSLNKYSVLVGEKVTFTVRLTPSTTGFVNLVVGDKSYKVVVIDGVGTFTLDDLTNGTYDVQAIFDGDDQHYDNVSDIKQLEVNLVPTDVSISFDKSPIFVGDKVVVSFLLNHAINTAIAVNFNGTDYVVGIINGQGNLTLSDLSEGIYNITATTFQDDMYDSGNKTVTMTVEKLETNLAANKITTTYNVNKDLVITLKDILNNSVSGVKVSVDLNGVKQYTTDKNGQITIATGNVVPNNYNVQISFKGNEKYIGSSITTKVVIKKATPKITAKAQTFNQADKIKKYTVTLKNNVNQVMKNAKVTFTIDKKTYTAKTNSKGVATFKLTKLTKTGSFAGKVTFAADKYYNQATKKVTIKVK